MPRTSVAVFGIPFVLETRGGILQKIEETWQKGETLRIATINPEFLVEAHSNSEFRENLKNADIRVVDGFGLWLALWLSGLAVQRITGVTLTEDVMALAGRHHKKVVIILSSSGLSTEKGIRKVLLKKYPDLSLELVTLEKDETLSENLSGDLFLIALGAPQQEYYAEEIRKGVVIGVGGALDFLTGAQKRAPRAFQTFGIEWLYRLSHQPTRFRRIIRAVIIFPVIFVSERIFNFSQFRLLQ